MKRSTFAAGLMGFAVLMAPLAVLAKSGGDHAAMSFEAMDADSDGQLTRAEMATLRLRHMSRADADGDGSLTAQELEAHAVRGATERAQQMMSRLDANADGVLSKEELSGGKRAMRAFDRADRNGDGVVTKAEFEEVRERSAQRRHDHD